MDYRDYAVLKHTCEICTANIEACKFCDIDKQIDDFEEEMNNDTGTRHKPFNEDKEERYVC